MVFTQMARSHGHGEDRTFEPLEPTEREVTYHVVKVNQANGQDAGFQVRILQKVDESLKVLRRLKGGRGGEGGRDPASAQGSS